jgi:hypothetical protein
MTFINHCCKCGYAHEGDAQVILSQAHAYIVSEKSISVIVIKKKQPRKKLNACE